MFQELKKISIHALREERDLPEYFLKLQPKQFQSTRSARSATLSASLIVSTASISIHALREERDGSYMRHVCGYWGISIHALREERDIGVFQIAGYGLPISIHALREERDLLIRQIVSHNIISIHALREERDKSDVRFMQSAYYFNPRAPRGARPRLARGVRPTVEFQSTRSARSATATPASPNVF